MLIVMGNNQVAFDSVCSAIIGLDARTVDHIRLAEDRGFGTTDLSKIEITGDVTLDEAKKRAKGFEVGLLRVEKYFEGTKFTAYAGPPPESEKTDYCWGGCPGAIEEAVEILRQFDKEFDEKSPRLHIVFGAYEGPIDAKAGEKVVFMGDCATWKGQLGDELVQITSKYRNRAHARPARRQARRHLRQARERPRQAAGREGLVARPLRGVPRQRGRAGARARVPDQVQEPVLRSRPSRRASTRRTSAGAPSPPCSA